MKDKPTKPPDPAPEEKATPPPDNPARRSAEWEDMEQTPVDEEVLALRRLKALHDIRGKLKP